MSDYLQQLGVVKRLFPLIVSGDKTSTIRWREQRIQHGPLQFNCDEASSQSIVVKVVRCTDMPLADAASFVGRADEWPDDVMLAGMREHYPEIKLSDIVQVVEFEPPSLI